MGTPVAFPYQGSKRKIADDILSFLPEDTDNLIESFAGSAAFSIAARYHNKVEKVILNDSNKPLMGVWDYILNDPYRLIDGYSVLWESQQENPRDFYDEIRDQFNEDYDPVKFLYLLSRCVKNAVRYNDEGGFNQSPDNRRLGRNPKTMKKHLLKINELLLNRSSLFATNFEEVNLKASRNDVIYMDPPYQGTSGGSKRYIAPLELDNFISHLEVLNAFDLSYIISFDGSTGEKTYGSELPKHLQLSKYDIYAGRSSQATLLGRDDETTESLYVSKALMDRLSLQENTKGVEEEQLSLFGG